MDNLDKKSILITGGATGLGFAMAKRFSEKGAFVTICGRRKVKIDEAVSNLKVNSIGIVADVTDEEDTNIISYDEPPPKTPTLVQGEKEIEKIFEDSELVIEENI